MDSRQEKPELLIVDTKSLRQASIRRFVETWADIMGLTVRSVLPDLQLEASCTFNNCEMIIISVGGISIGDAQYRLLIERLRGLTPKVPLVIISDREDRQEICAACKGGVVGFMPTSIEPSLAFQALSFIRNGGSFFPPSVLSQRPSVASNNGASASGLTAKQEEVFSFLCHGYSNKAIARELGMSEATVKVHARRIMQKFGVRNRAQLSAAATNQSSLPVTANGGKSAWG